MKANRQDLVVRGAKARAAIMSHLANHSTATVEDLAALPALKEFDDKASRNLVYNMKNAGLLSAKKDGIRNIYSAKGTITEKTAGLSVQRKQKASATFKVDYVKSSGRIRLTLNGLVIEIGVV